MSGTFGIDFGILHLEEEEPETLPTVGSAKLVIEDKCEALFFTAEWTIQATVGKHIIAQSSTRTSAHSEAFIRRWTRQVIRLNSARLRRLGVDVDTTYVYWGGILSELDN